MRLNATETGEGPPLILLHGLFGAAANLGAVARALAPAHRVISLDLRNHGASPHAAEMSYAAMAGDVAETMTALGLSRAAVAGHSMGGKVAMLLALAQPGRVKRLAVLDIAPVAYGPAFRGYAAAMQALPLVPGLTRAEAAAALAGAVPDAGMRAFLLQNLRFDGPAPAWRIGLEPIAAALPAIEAWPETHGGPAYPGPTLFLAGARSDYVQDAHRPLIRTLFPAARFVRVRDAGHWVHADAPAAVAATLATFLR
jgi:pimeloyl-ACP methyl ester carboxylesterase